jgi:hypothetical protein
MREPGVDKVIRTDRDYDSFERISMARKAIHDNIEIYNFGANQRQNLEVT